MNLLSIYFFGFEPTYKELKLIIYECECFVKQGFEPTYKELKPAQPPRSLQPRIGFEPTYKELKPMLSGASFCSGALF